MISTKINNKITVVMLVAASHSGSTLMDLIFDSHSQVKGVGELARFKNRLESGKKEQGVCSCGKKLGECEFWQKSFRDIDLDKLQPFCEKWTEFFFKRNYFDADYIEETEKLYRNILAHSGKRIIFDSSKNPVRAEILSQNPNLDVFLLHLVRDGRAVAYSNIKRGRSPFIFMKKWAINNIKTEIIKIRNGDLKNIFIRYKDFATDPERIIKHILRELNLKFEPEMLDFRKKKHHLTPGNYSLLFLKKGTEIKPDMEWEEWLPRKDRAIFNILFGWLNVFFKHKPKKY